MNRRAFFARTVGAIAAAVAFRNVPPVRYYRVRWTDVEPSTITTTTDDAKVYWLSKDGPFVIDGDKRICMAGSWEIES